MPRAISRLLTLACWMQYPMPMTNTLSSVWIEDILRAATVPEVALEQTVMYSGPMIAHTGNPQCICAHPVLAAVRDVSEMCIGAPTLRVIAAALCGVARAVGAEPLTPA